MSRDILVLDACALIAAQRGEVGGERVIERLLAAETRTFMHAINVCEVHYDSLRRDPAGSLGTLLDDLERLGIEVEFSLEPGLLERAASLKAYWRRVSLADCVALALAQSKGGRLLTTDHHEFDPLHEAGFPIDFAR